MYCIWFNRYGCCLPFVVWVGEHCYMRRCFLLRYSSNCLCTMQNGIKLNSISIKPNPYKCKYKSTVIEFNRGGLNFTSHHFRLRFDGKEIYIENKTQINNNFERSTFNLLMLTWNQFNEVFGVRLLSPISYGFFHLLCWNWNILLCLFMGGNRNQHFYFRASEFYE